MQEPRRQLHLTEQIKDHTFEKDYQAVLTGWLPDDEGTFRDYLLKDPKNNVSKIVKEGTPGAKEAILDYEVIDMMEDSKDEIHVLSDPFRDRPSPSDPCSDIQAEDLESGEIQSIIRSIKKTKKKYKRDRSICSTDRI